MPIARCPHCGLNVLFPADGVCPSCHAHQDAPVTTEDLARIEQIARPRAPSLRSAVKVGGLSAGGVVGVIVVYRLVFLAMRLLAESAPG